jgi:hypothetical protein
MVFVACLVEVAVAHIRRRPLKALVRPRIHVRESLSV